MMGQVEIRLYDRHGNLVFAQAMPPGYDHFEHVTAKPHEWPVHRVEVLADPPQPAPPAPSREDSPEFKAHVLHWLQTDGGHPEAVTLEHVSGYGTDWEGDTASGFHADNCVELAYTDEAGKQRHREIRGDDFESLWSWVVSAWPAPENAIQAP